MTLACTQAVTTARPAKTISVSSTDKPTGLLSCIREFIHWLALGMFLGCALNAHAKETQWKQELKGLDDGRYLPNVVKVGKEFYSLDEVDFIAQGIVGDTDTKMHTIRLLKGQKPGDMRDTLLHELLHVAANQSGKDYESKKRLEEDFVQRMTPRLLLILRENPKLMEFLTSQ